MKHKFSNFLTQKGRWLTAILFLLTFSIGNVWGAYSPVNNPATKTYGEITFLDVANTKANGKITATGAAHIGDSVLTYGVYYVAKTRGITTWFNSSDGSPASNHESTGYSIEDAADYGFFATSSTAGDINYGGTKCNSNRARYFYVTGATHVAAILRDGGSNSNKYAQIVIQTVAQDGTLGTPTNVGTYGSTSTGYMRIGGDLDRTKYYKISFNSQSSSNSYMYQIRLGKYIAPACDEANASIIANTSVYVNDELDLEFSSDNTNSVVYDIKKGGSATSDASITAGVFKATVAGTYVVTVTQAKDASNHCAVEESVTITVNPKTPVESVSVAGAAAGYKGTELTFTATAQYATDYEWYVDEVKQGSDSAKLHFTPTESKTYSIVCEAKNAFNSDWVASSAHSLTVTSLYGELIRATLTGGNNATMTGIIGGTFDSNLGSGKYKLDNDKYMGVQLASGYFQEGDTVIVNMTTAGSNYPCLFADKDRNTLLYLATETSSALEYKMVLPAAANNKNTVYLSRHDDDYKWNPVVAYISVVRPMPVKSKAYDLTAVKINGTAISAAELAMLKTGDAYFLDLATEYPAGPTVKFARQTTNTYEDDSQKVIDDTITVTATEVSSKWQAQATIGTITYTVNMAKVSAAKVYYYDGATKLGEEIVAINGSPVHAGDYDDKTLASFVGWYDNSGLTGDAVTIASATITKDTTFYGKWNPVYATSANLEQWVLDNGTSYDAWAQLGALGYAGSFTNSLDSLDDGPTKTNRNYAYLGFKVKNESGKQIDFRVANGNTVKIKFGHVSTTPKVQYNNTGDYDDMTITEGVYTYAADGADAYISIKAASDATLIFKQIMIGADPAFETVTLPAIVTLDADGGTYADASLKYTGTPLVIGDATPADDEHLFDGWYDGDTKVDASAYVPTKNVTLVAKYVLKPSPFSLTALTYTIGAGEAQNVGYVEGTYTYTVELPYAGSYENITVAATLKEGSSSIVEGAVMTVTSLPGAATFTVSDGAEGTQLYTINFKKGAKDGVEIIGVVTTGGTDKTVSGLYKGDASVNLDDDQKIGNGKYIYVTLASGYTFEETDVLVVDLKAKSDLSGGTKALEITTGVGNIDGDVWKSIAYEDYTVDENTISLEGIAAGQTSIGLKRSANQNAWVNGLKVYRPMMPELAAISFNGFAATKGTGNAFSVTLPEAGTNLASLTIVPTIIRNAAHATTPEAVISNEGAWVEGDNTYRVMDKDGDYTDYTITITLQGAAETPVITADPASQAYCAGSEPTLTVAANDPSDGGTLHYAWFKAGETDEAVGSDQASYTVAGAGTYYVIVTNHVDGKLDASVTSENAVVTLNTPASITTQPTDLKKQIEGANITLSVVAANATGYQWYSCDNKDKENPSLIAGADEADYEFAAAAGFYYCEVTGLCGAVESNVAEVTIKRSAGCQYINATSGSQATLTDGTIMYACGSDGKLSTGDNFAEASANAKALDADAVGSINKQYCVVKFPADVEEITLFGYNGSSRSVNNLCYGTAVGTDVKVNTAISSDDYVKTASNDGNERSMTIEFDEPFAKEKYLFIKYNSALEIYRICYTAALVEPKLPTLVNQELCAGAAYEEFDATITNAAACEGTVSYKWYETTDTENPVATTAKFTPSEEGTYYVVVTHSASGHITRTAQSANLSVAHFDALSLVSYSDDVYQHMGTEATLSVVATGKNVAYVWYTCSNAAGDDAVAITPAETESSLTIASVAEGVQYYKVVISHDCDATTLSHVFKVEGWNQLDQVDVTATTTWDMTNVSASAINLKDDFDPSKQNERLLLANIDGVNNNASFNSQALMFEGQHIGRTDKSVKHLAGRYVQFNVTVPGAVFVTFASNGDNARTISINGKKCSRTTSGTAADKYITYALAVEPGSVEIVGYEGESANQYVRISKIEFKTAVAYPRTVNPNNIGTLCWTNNAILGGATLYELRGKNENNYLVFDEVAENRLEAGKPYIFVPENGNTQIKVYNTDNDAVGAPVQNESGMQGTFDDLSTIVDGENSPLWNKYIISNNHYVYVDYTNCRLGAYRAYVISLDDLNVVSNDPEPVNGTPRRRLTIGGKAPQNPTGMDELNAADAPVKVMINGELFILRGEKMYDATGRLVK